MPKRATKSSPKKQLLTPEEWKQFEESIGTYSMGYVLIDGIPFSFGEVRYKNKIVIDFYIAGWQWGNWILKNHRFKKYYRQCSGWIIPKKDRETSYRFWKKMKGKKYADQWLEDKRYSYVSSIFGSFRTLKSHLNSVAEEIQLQTKEENRETARQYRVNHPEDFPEL